jgi:hypothetical protein
MNGNSKSGPYDAQMDEPTEPDPAAPGTRRFPTRPFPWVRARWIILGVLIVGGLWGYFAYRKLDEARTAATAGVDKLQKAKDALTADQLLKGEGLGTLREAEKEFKKAHDAADSPLLGPLTVLPVIGRQINSVSALTDSANTVVDTGINAVNQAQKTIKGATGGGEQRVKAVASIQSIAADATARLKRVDLGPGEGLIGALAKARTKFIGDLNKLRDGLDNLQKAGAGVHSFLQGPTKYLVVAANNAEMRGGSGMWLSVGMMDAAAGHFSVGDMISTSTFQVPQGQVAIDNADLAARWGWTFPNVEWRNLAMSPDFPANAQLAARMWKAKTGQAVAGVIVIDAVALQSVLDVTGPVVLPDGTTITADNVIEQILLKQYLGLDQTASTNGQRREELSIIARAALDALNKGGWDASKLVQTMKGAAAGRHILAWSSDPVQEAGWTGAGVDGTVPKNGVMVSLLSQGGNKLDQFVSTSVHVTSKATTVGIDVTLTVDLANTTPTGLPKYVAGPTNSPEDPTLGAPEGVYAGILSVDVPGPAGGSKINNGAVPAIAAGADGNNRVIAGRFSIARGQKETFTVTFTLPRSGGTMIVEPSARIPSEQWTFGKSHWTDDSAHTIHVAG